MQNAKKVTVGNCPSEHLGTPIPVKAFMKDGKPVDIPGFAAVKEGKLILNVLIKKRIIPASERERLEKELDSCGLPQDGPKVRFAGRALVDFVLFNFSFYKPKIRARIIKEGVEIGIITKKDARVIDRRLKKMSILQRVIVGAKKLLLEDEETEKERMKFIDPELASYIVVTVNKWRNRMFSFQTYVLDRNLTNTPKYHVYGFAHKSTIPEMKKRFKKGDFKWLYLHPAGEAPIESKGRFK